MHHGLVSLFPPVVALGCALATRNVVASLAAGVLVGFTAAEGWNPYLGLVRLIEEGLFGQLAKQSHAGLIVLILVIGGFVGLLERSGGMGAFARRLAAWVKGKVAAQLTVWISGIAIFFSDSATPLVLGPIFRPVMHKVDVSREKLAYILDSTASPVCVLVPFISWGVYVMSLIDQAYASLKIEGDSFATFLGMLQFQFYPALALLTVPLVVVTGRDVGPMSRPAPLAAPVSSGDSADGESADAPPSAVFVPMLVLLTASVGLVTLTYRLHGGLTGSRMQTALTMAYALATVTAIFLLWRARVMGVKATLAAFRGGVEKMLLIPLILLLAWSLGHTCELLGTGRYLAGLSRSFLTPALLSATIFLVGAVISFAMGSAWGTFALLMPLSASIAHQMGVGLRPALAAVTSGGLFGDHASPISDTTILASMGAGCRHIDHVRTQLPYALLPAAISVVAFVLSSQWESPWILAGSCAVLAGLVLPVARRFGSPTRGNRLQETV